MSSNRLTRSVAPTVAAVKPLFDSVYLKPHENPRVIQDNAYAKRTVLEEALNRHSKGLESDRDSRQKLLTKHYEQIHVQEEKARIKLEREKQAEKETQEALKEMIKDTVSVRFLTSVIM